MASVSVTPTAASTLDALFPLPPNDHSLYASVPGRLPGTTKESMDTLVRLLKEDHEKCHIFFNEKGFHNHTSHHLYAIYALGASPKVLEAAFHENFAYQRASFDSPEEITEANWMQHFDDERFYRSYLKFFTKSVLTDGIATTLEKYVFAPGSNWVESIKEDEKQPQMLNRLMSGVLHPYIHCGYGIEFSSPGMIAEGLAMGCVQEGTDLDPLIPASYFSSASLTSRLATALTLSKENQDTHSFSILAQVAQDPDLSPEALGFEPSDFLAVKKSLAKAGEKIRQYAEKWMIDPTNKEEVKVKVEELAFLVTLIYGAAGKEFKASFFTMHLVTSYLFIPAFVDVLSPSSTVLLLRVYLAAALTVWVAIRRPAISIQNFYANSSPTFIVPGAHPSPHAGSLASGTPDGVQPNPWIALLQSTLVHPDEHLPKAQRSLAHFAREYGMRGKGHFEGTGLEGAEELDGTIFARAAGLTMDKLGWMREGEPRGNWGR